MNTKYIVKRPFKYGEVQYSQGDIFLPLGGRYDKGIIENHCTAQLVPDNDEQPAGATRKAKNGK